MKLSRMQFVEQMKRLGMRFSHFSLESTGRYKPSDADWNYKDMLHFESIHDVVRPVNLAVEDDFLGAVYIQKALGIRIPINVVSYQPRPNTMICCTTGGLFFVVIIENIFEAVNQSETRVSSNYSIGYPWVLSWFAPVIRWTLKRNYKKLMAADLPMRERKGLLRSWGYSFHTDSTPHTFSSTLDMSQQNVILPGLPAFPAQSIRVESDLPDGQEKLIGRSDHLGLRLIREGNQLLVHRRICLHEGASMDSQKCQNKKLTCPWHAKQLGPLAVFDLVGLSVQSQSTDFHTLTLDEGVLSISAKAPIIEQKTQGAATNQSLPTHFGP